MDNISKDSVFNANMSILESRFPEIATSVRNCSRNDSEYQIEFLSSVDGPVLYLNEQCMDHPTKPKIAAVNWVNRELRDARFSTCDNIAVFDSGCGYHVEALLDSTDKKVSLIVVDAFVFKSILENCDFTKILSRIDSLFLSGSEEFSGKTELLVRPQIQVVCPSTNNSLRTKFYGSRGLSSLHPKIGVLGPVRGGTGPIMGYTARALASTGERVRMIDMSGFDSGYQAISDLINNSMLKNNAQGKYIEMLSDIVLQSIQEKPVDILICMALAPITGETLAELRRRGIITVLWFVEDYQRFKTWQLLAPYFDFIFTIQRGDCIDAIKQAGCSEVHYLPTGCDPIVHRPMQLTPEEQEKWGSPISFVGAGYHNRQQTFASFANMPFKIWGTEWPECKPFDRMVQEGGRRLTPDEYVKIFNATKVNINLHSSMERDGVDPNGDFLNPRTFELACSGAFQLVDSRTLLPEAFTPGVDIVTYDNVQELKEKTEYFLTHEEERKKFIERSRETALKKHTYQHRMKEMLSIIYSRCYEVLKRRADSSPWHAILERTKKFSDQELYKRCQIAFQRGEEPGLDGLVADIVTGKGSLTETEQKLLLLFHISKQVIRMTENDRGLKHTM